MSGQTDDKRVVCYNADGDYVGTYVLFAGGMGFAADPPTDSGYLTFAVFKQIAAIDGFKTNPITEDQKKSMDPMPIEEATVE